MFAVPLGSDSFDLAFFWTWFLLWSRCAGIFSSLIGIGTEEVPITFRGAVTLLISLAITLVGLRAPMPAHWAEGTMMMASEFLLGFLLGFIPRFVVSSITVAGNITTGAVGLGQANMIDPSLGEPVAILARFQTLVATLVFLSIDGHHAVIQAAAGFPGSVGIGQFVPDLHVAGFLIERFRAIFELAVSVAAPVIVALLVTQFVLGLVTRAVPQVNIFIVSLPLTIGLGLFIIAYTFTGMTKHVIRDFTGLEKHIVQVMTPAR